MMYCLFRTLKNEELTYRNPLERSHGLEGIFNFHVQEAETL